MSSKIDNPLLSAVASLLSRLLRLIYPPKCAVCNAMLYESGELCSDCLEIWNRARRTKCPVCQKTARGCTCRVFSLMATDSIGDRRISSLVFFPKRDATDEKELMVRRIVYSAKTDTALDAIRLCARELSRDILKTLVLAGETPEDWKLTYPPRSGTQRRKYGFDQSRDLTKLISRYTGIPMETTLKNCGSLTQKKLNSLERRLNAQESYKLKKNVVPKGNYIIVDDVITTGATVNNAAMLLKSGGASRVYPVCIARTKSKKRKIRRPSSNPWFRSK